MNNIVEALAPQLAAHGFTLLVLTQKSFAGWSEDDAKRLFDKTLPEIGKLKQVDVRKPVLLGYSAGGQMALELWNADPGRWGGLVLDAAYPVRLENGKFVPRPLPKSDDIKKTPFLVLVGVQDGGSPLWKKLTPQWQEAGVPLTIRHIDGKGHTWLFGKAEVGLLEKWLADVAAGKLPNDTPTDAPKEKD
jgi:predicted esterase